ncbi:uncharacterized protein LOC142830149 [Pelodiscus sinensis]|uniref:uncharacterized protein LOC142830149 n=1 Tax=Pelodiscus sinensis TaxID=13735 RepID=UPI003F6D0B30
MPLQESSSSPDEALADPALSLPSMDACTHQDLRRMAANLAIPVEPVIEDTDPMVDILTEDTPARLALPLNKTVSKITNALWQTPATLTPTLKGAERRYYVPNSEHDYLYSQPNPGSLVVQAAAQKERLPQPGPSPKAREPKRLDLLGRKVYATGALQLRIANQQAMLSRYAFNTWQAVEKFRDRLPVEDCQEFTAVALEGKVISQTALQAALDTVDSAAHTMATGVVMRRGAWLHVSGIPPDVQHTIQDLPFEGKALFSEHTDSRLHTLKDTRSTLKSLGIHTPAPQRRHLPYRQQGRAQPQVPCGDYWRRRSWASGGSSRASAHPQGVRGRHRRPRTDTQHGGPHSPSHQGKPQF